jgi:hypothetical protein
MEKCKMTVSEQIMPKTFIFILGLITIFHSQQVLAQENISEKEFNKYRSALKLNKVDSVLVLKVGCTGCVVGYPDTSMRVTDGLAIYVLSQHKGIIKLAVFDDVYNPKYFTPDTCLLFDLVNKSKSTLKLKAGFYKKEMAELRKAKFFPPGPVHYSFEELKIQLPNFKYDFVVAEKNADYLGFVRENEEWFQATRTIIESFLKISVAGLAKKAEQN